MDNHPIPQDVTGFQFKLIGDMTVKQLAYLIGGGVLAWLFYSLPLIAVVKYPLAIGVACLGTALAFLPIEQRPMDVMIAHFFRAVFSPNQYVYHKVGAQLIVSIFQPKKEPPKQQTSQKSQAAVRSFIQATAVKQQSKYDEKEQMFFSLLDQSGTPLNQTRNQPDISMLVAKPVAPQAQLQPVTPPLQQQSPIQNLPQKTAEQERIEHEKKEAEIKKAAETINATLGIAEDKTQSPAPVKPQQQTTQEAPVIIESTTLPQSPSQQSPVQPAPKTPSPLSFPNLVSGIIRDTRGNVIPNILVEVKDADSNPVRAFKTNALGQFASATPLSDGKYTLSFEDTKAQHVIPSVSIEATGQPLAQLEIRSEDERTRLHNALFGGQTVS